MNGNSKKYILAVDQGTSGTKALLFDRLGKVVKKASASLHTNYTSNGFAEQQPGDILESVQKAVQDCLKDIQEAQLIGVGISNQRETFLLWDARGKPVCPAIVWSCKRSVAICSKLKQQEKWLRSKTGLMVDPYFSGTKLLWLMENEPGLPDRIAAGEVFFGTVDTWLLYQLTGGTCYLTDHTNASRTLLFNLSTLDWDQEIIEKWGLSGLNLPAIRPSASNFGQTDLFGILGEGIPVLSMIGDSHAAMFGEACFEPGDTKITMGTGCSLLSNTGDNHSPGDNGLLATVGWSTAEGVVYAREGAIVACGSMIEWLKSLGIVRAAEETARMAREAVVASGVRLVPAFSGLGAPFWQMERKASFHGLRFGTGKAQLVRATLESICFQIRAVLDAMEADGGIPIRTVAMHGGLSNNTFIREYLSSLLPSEIHIQDNPDISAQGAAFLAGFQSGLYENLHSLKALLVTKKLERPAETEVIEEEYLQWLKLVQKPD